MVPVSSRDLGSAGSMSYRIVGGYNDNAVQVFFRMEKGYELEWLYLRTFTGGYMKYIMPGKAEYCTAQAHKPAGQEHGHGVTTGYCTDRRLIIRARQ